MRFWLILGLFLIINISYASGIAFVNNPEGDGAQCELVKKGDCNQLSFVCDNCSFANISSVIYPNQTMVALNRQMSQLSPGLFNYTNCRSDVNGKYEYVAFGNPDGIQKSAKGCYEVGRMSLEEVIIYVLLVAGIFFFFGFFLYFAIVLPYKNEVDEKSGMVVKVTRLKYVKLLCIMLSYAFFTWFINSMIGISDNLATLRIFYGFFSFMFTVLMNLAKVFGLFIIVLTFIEIVRDTNAYRTIKEAFGR